MREKTYRIGEAADMLHLKSYVLRFWETEFPQLAPLRTDKGQRLYTDQHIALLRRIKQLLHEQGMTIEGARRVLAAASLPDGSPAAQAANSLVVAHAANSLAVAHAANSLVVAQAAGSPVVAHAAGSPVVAQGAGSAPAPLPLPLPQEAGKNPTINRAVVREMREELLALRHMLTADE